MTTMVERMATAFVEAIGDAYVHREPGGGRVYVEGDFDLVAAMRAVLQPIGAPRMGDITLPMLAAGKKALYSCSSDPELEDARGCWQAMIEAAMKEGQ